MRHVLAAVGGHGALQPGGAVVGGEVVGQVEGQEESVGGIVEQAALGGAVGEAAIAGGDQLEGGTVLLAEAAAVAVALWRRPSRGNLLLL